MTSICAKRGYAAPMLRLATTTEDKRPAPLDREERIDATTAVLAKHGIFTRRTGHAHSIGITVTYLHLSEAADGPVASHLLAHHLDWDQTDIADVAGTVAVTTHRG